MSRGERSDEESREITPKPEPINPHEIVNRCIMVQSERSLKELKDAEITGLEITLLEGNIDMFLSDISYSKGNVPQVHSWNLSAVGLHSALEIRPGEDIDDTPIYPKGDGFIIPHYIAKEERPKIDVEFGRQAITTFEAIRLIGEQFQEKAEKAMAERDDVKKEGHIRHEILPGIDLVVSVIDNTHWAMNVPVNAEALKEQEGSPYEILWPHLVIPLDGEVPLTGRRLLEKFKYDYLIDFKRRYAPILKGMSPKQAGLFHKDFSQDEATQDEVSGLVDYAIAVKEKLGLKPLMGKDFASVLQDPEFLSPEVRLYCLAKMEAILLDDGKTYSLPKESGINEQLSIITPIYQALRAEQQKKQQKDKMDVLYKMHHRGIIPPLREEEKQRIIDKNLKMLEKKLIGETSDHELDEKAKQGMRALISGERRYIDPTKNSEDLEVDLQIYYETSSGKICKPDRDDFLPGDYSRFHTSHISMGRHSKLIDGKHEVANVRRHTIGLIQPSGSPTISELNRAVGGKLADAPDEENRRLLPERLIPGKEYNRRAGKREQWGQSELTPYAEGDLVLLRTIQLFNQRFGRSS